MMMTRHKGKVLQHKGESLDNANTTSYCKKPQTDPGCISIKTTVTTWKSLDPILRVRLRKKKTCHSVTPMIPPSSSSRHVVQTLALSFRSVLVHRVPYTHRPFLHGQDLVILRIVEASDRLPDAISDHLMDVRAS